MKKFSSVVFSLLMLALLGVVVPTLVLADHDGETRWQRIINGWVERVEEQVERLMARQCEKFAKYHKKYNSDMPDFCDEDGDEPEPTPTPTSTPTPTPTETPSPTPTETPSPTPEPEGGLVISEVYYDVDTTGGKGVEGDNEWVELYNGTDSEIDVSGYTLEDEANVSGEIPASTMIAAGGRLVVTRDVSTGPLWSVDMTVLGTTSLSLNNGAETLYLKDGSAATVDALNWGGNTEVFSPTVPGVDEGSSLGRSPVTTDTDTAADWVEQETPTPGS